MKIVVLAAIAIAAATVPASAQSGFQVGQVVTPSDEDAIEACLTIDDLNNYRDAANGCAFGATANCEAMVDLEKRKVCGPSYKSYVVIGINPAGDALQISPVENRSVTYWATADQFDSGN